MKYPAQALTTLVAGCVLSVTTSGCITITPTSPTLSWKSITKPKIERASYEEKVPEAPGEPKNPAKLKVAYGRLMEESGQLAEARKNYAAAIEIQPKEVDAILGLARLDQLAGNNEQAELGYKKAVKLAPNSSQAQYNLGQFYASQDRWEDATECLTKAMLAEPDDTQSRYALAVALVHTGKVDAALPHFIRTIGDAEAHYNVGLILQGGGHLEDAERHFALAVTKKPELVAAQDWLVHVRQQRQNGPPAIDQSVPEKAQGTILPAGHSTAATPEASQKSPSAPVPADRKLSAQQVEQEQNQRPL
ncbi:tetratricopeptide repeat protein [Planctomicrobium sp. SH661]|uniref:tetratricopeptide repeat protein n=1 Tax=Planctomicrobium sp. SH661 TaxID=3448124 RepID=UPI003F5BDFB1